MRSSASSCARQVLQRAAPEAHHHDFAAVLREAHVLPDRPRATRSGAGWPSSAYFSAAAATPPREHARERKRSKTRLQRGLGLTNKRALTVGSTKGTPGKRTGFDATRAKPSHSPLNNVNEAKPLV